MTVDDIISQFKKDIAADPGYWDLYALSPENVVLLIAEIEWIRAREKSARVCSEIVDQHGDMVKCSPRCTECKGTGIVYDG